MPKILQQVRIDGKMTLQGTWVRDYKCRDLSDSGPLGYLFTLPGKLFP